MEYAYYKRSDSSLFAGKFLVICNLDQINFIQLTSKSFYMQLFFFPDTYVRATYCLN